MAQQRVMKNDARQAVASAKKAVAGKEVSTSSAASFAPQSKSVVINRYDLADEAETMITFSDLQSNQYVANRMYQLPNGNVAVVATFSSDQTNPSGNDRGTGYNFFDGNDWMDLPDARIESFKTGWPSIAQWGENGEILLCHGNNGMQCFVREVAGQGEWIHKGALPAYPEGYPYPTEYPTWPRVVTCGDNHNIIVAVAVLQHTISEDEGDLQTVMWRSEDAENWTVSYGPLEEVGQSHNTFSADDYCMAANGHTVAILYSGCLTNSTWLCKSTDDGLNWETTRVWENPYEGREFDEEPAWGMEDTLYMPMNGTVTIDPQGIVHVALNTFEMAHTLDDDPGYFSYWMGRAVDGILYWNDTQDPIHDTDHPEYIGTAYEAHYATANPHHAARLWWPEPDESGYFYMLADSTKWIGFVPVYENHYFDANYYFMKQTEYVQKFYGTSGHPALSCDSEGNLAMAYSTPDVLRIHETDAGAYYYRSIFMSVKKANEDGWYVLADSLTCQSVNPMHMISEAVFTNAVSNTVNPNEFWFSYQADEEQGFFVGNDHTQESATPNSIYVVKVHPEVITGVAETEAVNPMTTTRVYPTPTKSVLNVEVNASQHSDVNISVFNIMGQKVSEMNTTLGTGINTTTINTESLSSGIYFVTVKANGFENTMKFVVE